MHLSIGIGIGVAIGVRTYPPGHNPPGHFPLRTYSPGIRHSPGTIFGISNQQPFYNIYHQFITSSSIHH